MLKARGHEVAVFAMDYPENLETPWQKYFPSNMSKLKAFTRPFGDGETKSKFSALMDDFKPEVVHLNNIHTQISPIIAEIAKNHGARVIWTLHDMKLLCPRYDCMRDGKECKLCFDPQKKIKCFKHSCMKGGKIGSYIGYREAKVWNRERLQRATDVFLCPSQFMADRMIEGGFDRSKLSVLCNFIDISKCNNREGYFKKDYYCFIGRLGEQKGVRTLIEAANQLPYHLVVIGDGPLSEELKRKSGSNIEFVGYKQWNDIKEIVGHAKFTVLPSEGNENNPLTIIEAKCLGTPVLGSRKGGIPELINEGVDGMTFEAKSVEDLKGKITKMWNTRFDYADIARKSMKRYNAEHYYKEIMKIYQK